MPPIPVAATITNNNGSYTWGVTVSGIQSNEVDVQANTSTNITVTIGPPTGSTDIVRFATPALTWFNNSNPALEISTPIPFQVTESNNVITIADNNASGNTGTFTFLINALYNGALVQSPDPTIINKDQ